MKLEGEGGSREVASGVSIRDAPSHNIRQCASTKGIIILAARCLHHAYMQFLLALLLKLACAHSSCCSHKTL
jgi:hypothetical protein